MAFLRFAREKCDVVVLEAGVGGRLDSTNVIASPLAAVICSVSLDHTAVLGKTVEEIAEQKAGIIKRGSPAVLAPENPPSVVEIIRRRAEECGTSLVIPDTAGLKIGECTAFGNRFEYKGEKYATAMGGYHQIKNALTVIETAGLLRAQGYGIPQNALAEGLKAQIPGRIQVLSENPLVIVDGGHNPDGVKALADALGTLGCKKRVVIGMLGDKDSDSAAGYIAKAADGFVCVDGFYPNARPRNQLAELLKSHGANAVESPISAEETVKRELKTLEADETLIISGSLFLAAKFADGKIVRGVLECLKGDNDRNV
jgi:dihydrofolate synthase/folylpolyglutamate synthase